MTPLAGLPLLGGLVELLDKVLADLGFPLWFRAFLELAAVAIIAYLVLRLLTTKVLPWIGTAFVGPVVWVAEVLRVLLLLPDLAVSLGVRRFGRVPPEVAYAYGSVVVSAVDGVQDFARKGLPTLAITRRAHKALLVGLLVMGFLVWNNGECLPAADGTCATPVTSWKTSLTGWFDELTQ